MKRARLVLLCTLTLAVTHPPVLAGAVPIGLARESREGSAPGPAVDVGARESSAADQAPGYLGPVVIVLSSAFAAGVLLGLRPLTRRRRRRHAVTAGEPAVSPAPRHESTPAPTTEGGALLVLAGDGDRAEPPGEPAPPVHAPPPLRLVPRWPAGAATTRARERHIGLYDSEYAQHVIRVQCLRDDRRPDCAGRDGARDGR